MPPIGAASNVRALDQSNMASGAQSSNIASVSRRLYASVARRMSCTFSCDIAYSDSPAASRASRLSRKFRTWTIFPFLKQTTTVN